jgi:hypothetical protein
LTSADRKYLGWAIAGFVLLGLVALGTVTYKPLKTRYAIHKLRNTDYGRGSISADWDYVQLVLCAARSGDRSAMDALINLQGTRFGFYPLCEVPEWPASCRAAFYEQLAPWPDSNVCSVLHPMAELIGQNMDCEGVPEGYRFVSPFAPANFVETMAPLAEKAGNPQVRELAGELLNFVRRRFAKDLAEAEKAAEAKP